VPTLPKPFERGENGLWHGAVVHLNSGWDFFDAEEPAYVYGRAGRMGASSSVNIRKAALCRQYLPGIKRDYRQLYIGEAIQRSRENDAYYVQRFAAGLRETPLSSYWSPAKRPPTVRTW